MSLPRETRIGPYEVLSLLGAGGMGEVYRARDTRLDRIVALKILPPDLGLNEARRARFQREARAISALSHPNICTLFDVGTHEDTEYLVMEYLEGETLAERLARGPLPQSVVLRLGAQIADALHHAHRAGITHRDLKPGNVMLTASGVKLVDFGLAKFIEPAPGVFSELSTATANAPLTGEGRVVGTMRYMSPEQVEGRSIDHRTDIFSFGVILYEMTTGERPFQGDSAAGLVAAILSSDPAPMRSLQPTVGAALERVVLTALEKDADERWQTAQDVGRQLRWISESSQPSEVSVAAPRRRLTVGALVALAAVTGAILAWATTRVDARKSETEARLELALPSGVNLWLQDHDSNNFAVSRDGRSLAFVASELGTTVLYLRALDSFDARRVDASQGALSPFWSSDGEWLGYTAGGKLWKTRTRGDSPPQVLCEVSTGGIAASWQGDTILFVDMRGSEPVVKRVAAQGGTPAVVVPLRSGEFRHGWPQLLPDGKRFLYSSFANASLDRRLILASLEAKEESVLATNVSFARLFGTNRLAYVRDGSLIIQDFDADRGRLSGDPQIVATEVSYFYATGRAEFDASPGGTIVFRTDTRSGRISIYDRSGAVESVIETDELPWDVSASPDGTKAVVALWPRTTGLTDLWIFDLARGVKDRFTSDPGVEVSPSWSPDGRTIAYSRTPGGAYVALALHSLSEPVATELTSARAFLDSARFAPDGKTIYFGRYGPAGSDIHRIDLGTREEQAVIATAFDEGDPVVSPDGKWLAFVSNQTGTYAVHVQSLDATRPSRARISKGTGAKPRWMSGRNELFFLTEDGTVTSALPGSDGRWETATLKELFRIQERIQAFDVMPDGKTFLVSVVTPGEHDDLLRVMTRLE